MLETLSKKLKAARARVAHYALGLAIADRRIAYFEKRVKIAEVGDHPELLLRARKLLSAWRIRRTKLTRLQKRWKEIVMRRAARKKKYLEEHPPGPPDAPGPGEWVLYDGHEVPRWMAEINERARDAGYWTGSVISGRRTRQYSRELCENMCGAPSCPGRCAGELTNHTGPPTFMGVPFEGAEDVTDPYGLRHYCETHNEPLVGGGAVLPSDINHFSHAGN